MTAYPRFQENRQSLHIPTKCSRSIRPKVGVKSVFVVTSSLVVLSIVASTLYLSSIQDSLNANLSVGSEDMFDWSTNVRGTVETSSLPDKSNIQAFPEHCDWRCYVGNYKDLHHLKSEDAAIRHWIDYGADEGRDCVCKSKMPDYCKWECYLDNYEDLKNLDRTEKASMEHYLAHGIDEERDCSCPSTSFRTKTANDTAVICVIASEEEMYIDEWLDYHLGVGFGHIYVYDNSYDNDLGRGWLSRRPRLTNKVTVQHFPGVGKQLPAYRHCLNNFVRPNGDGWVAFLDVDEFLVLKKHATVIDFLLEHARQGSVSLNWELFGWDQKLQFSREPVLKRFQGKVSASENRHVKTIANVDSILPGQPQNPHYVHLIDGHTQHDTNGDVVVEMWNNARRPTDIAVINHYHTKSHKEYIDKRSRGRSDLAGSDLSTAIMAKSLQMAKRGDNLLQTDQYDDLAWLNLLATSSKYKMFDSQDLHIHQKLSHQYSLSRLSICGIVTSQEAYIDEWIDYHFSLGISMMYLYDSSDEFWMRHWVKERGIRSRVVLNHLPGDISNPAFVATVYSSCLKDNLDSQNKIALIQVNDFLMPSQQSNLRHDTQHCATKVSRILFGNGGKSVYDPLPVTKRFQYRVDDYPMSPIMLASNHMLEDELLDYLTTENEDKDHCASAELIAYHYIRSTKECNQQRGDVELCYIAGNISDSSGWDRMQKALPAYAGFNTFL